MKTHILLAFVATLLCASCKTAEQNQRLSAIIGVAISAAERRGLISPEDAADVRSAKVLVLDSAVVENPTPGAPSK